MQKKMPSGGQNEQNMNNDAANVQERQYKRMTTEPVSRVVLSMGIPAVIGMLVTSIYNSADTYFVGQLGSSVVVAGFIGGLKGFVDRVGDLILMEGDHSTVPFPYLLYRGHEALRSFSHFLKFANKIPSSTGYLVVCLKRKHIILCLLFFSTHMIAPVASSVKS